jgi:hypothetical protein
MKTLQELQQSYIDSCARYGQAASEAEFLKEEVLAARQRLKSEMERENAKD